jgi:hypothetical protein
VVVSPTGNTQAGNCCGVAAAIDYAGNDAAMFTSQNNLFDYDNYYNINGTNGNIWAWGTGTSGNWQSFSAFQANGQEVHGTATASPVP